MSVELFVLPGAEKSSMAVVLVANLEMVSKREKVHLKDLKLLYRVKKMKRWLKWTFWCSKFYQDFLLAPLQSLLLPSVGISIDSEYPLWAVFSTFTRRAGITIIAMMSSQDINLIHPKSASSSARPLCILKHQVKCLGCKRNLLANIAEERQRTWGAQIEFP